MTFREVTVLQPKTWDITTEDYFFNIKVKEVSFIVWRNQTMDIFKQLEYATHNLQSEDYPIKINIRIDGIVHSIEIPEYVHDGGQGASTKPRRTY